ncbi:MAG TPA: hypothetical protein VMH80_21740 [Bryobacteraceae bacterium]|nr:hypothetical protein [Bryobacteraceae bacterium]
MKPIACFTKALFALAGIAACSTALAQSTTKPCYAPGKGPTFTITMEGRYANTITNVNVLVTTDASQTSDHLNRFGSPSEHPSSPRVFTVTVLIPANAVAGRYSVATINAAGEGFAVAYQSPADFTAPPPFEVCAKFEKPSVKSITETP